ncbi:hypothetical protein PR048_008276 [Dryococelus australis]|uniref:Uncharacterized protein n=1 Tax=Dryococelus australis TaxID=614101 RepID=A0ABQ9HWM7_9NEOP|nr:hypothetical protein PR048_008276 [Dryococelus australis]
MGHGKRNDRGIDCKYNFSRASGELEVTANSVLNRASGAAGNHERGYGDVVRLLVSHIGKPVSIPDGVSYGFSRVGVVPDDAAGRRVFFFGDLPFPRSLHSGAAPYLTRFNLIGSQDFDVKSHPNLSTPLLMNQIGPPALQIGGAPTDCACRTIPLVSGFSRGSPVPPAPSFRLHSIFTSIALIGSQDLAVKSLLNLTTHSYFHYDLDFATIANRLLEYASDDFCKNEALKHGEAAEHSGEELKHYSEKAQWLYSTVNLDSPAIKLDCHGMSSRQSRAVDADHNRCSMITSNYFLGPESNHDQPVTPSEEVVHTNFQPPPLSRPRRLPIAAAGGANGPSLKPGNQVIFVSSRERQRSCRVKPSCRGRTNGAGTKHFAVLETLAKLVRSQERQIQYRLFTGMKRGGNGAAPKCKYGAKREISEETRLQTASYGTITKCRNTGASPPAIEPGSPWWEWGFFPSIAVSSMIVLFQLFTHISFHLVHSPSDREKQVYLKALSRLFSERFASTIWLSVSLVTEVLKADEGDRGDYEACLNKWAGETGDPRENSPTSGASSAMIPTYENQ